MLKTYANDDTKNNTDDNTDTTHETTQTNESITGIECIEQHRNNTDDNTSKINNIINNKNNNIVQNDFAHECDSLLNVLNILMFLLYSWGRNSRRQTKQVLNILMFLLY